jgi:copper transport protein
MDADTSAWVVLAALNRWALYALMLISAGSALFVLLTPIPQRVADAALNFGKRTAPFAAVCFVAALGLGGAEIMAGGLNTLWSGSTWTMGANTSLGRSAALGVPAMIILWAGFTWRLKMLLGIGAAGGIVSFLVTGHAATADPVWAASMAVAVHLTGAAYWVGALFPLYYAMRDCDSTAAGDIIVAFSYRAVGFVLAIVASGVIIIWIQPVSLEALFSTTYGIRLCVKIGLFGLLLALAAYNKLILTPRILSGSGQAREHLRQVIRVEYVLILLVLAAAVTLTLTEPPRTHRHADTSAAQSHTGPTSLPF